jgi:hypothetical protein
MKSSEVPQDGNPMLGGERKLAYAVDEGGRYKGVASDGWEVEELVTSLAVEDFERQAVEARARVEAGRSAPLEFHMRPWIWRRVSASTRAIYARVLGLDVATLASLPAAGEDGS